MIRLALHLDLIAFGIVAVLFVIQLKRKRREHDQALRRVRYYKGADL